jgi:hypothetical protein
VGLVRHYSSVKLTFKFAGFSFERARSHPCLSADGRIPRRLVLAAAPFLSPLCSTAFTLGFPLDFPGFPLDFMNCFRFFDQ